MPESDQLCRSTLSICLFFLIAGLVISRAATCAAQSADDGYFARTNTFGILGAYSWDSSHMLLGAAANRELLSIGVSYSRRLLMNHIVNWQYDSEFLPVALESDPTDTQIVQYAVPGGVTATYNVGAAMLTCNPVTVAYDAAGNSGGTPTSYTVTDFCSGRRWTVGEAVSPVGMQWNFLPRHRIQPLLEGHGGYMFSTGPIPITSAGAFNFTFDFGAGFEVFHTRSSSIRFDYRYHHISNHYTATTNPGIDSGLVQVTYCFRIGRRH